MGGSEGKWGEMVGDGENGGEGGGNGGGGGGAMGEIGGGAFHKCIMENV